MSGERMKFLGSGLISRDGCEILHQLIGGIHADPIIFRVSTIRWCGISQPSTVPSGNLTWLLKMAIAIVEFPSYKIAIFHSYVYVYQRVPFLGLVIPVSFSGMTIPLCRVPRVGSTVWSWAIWNSTRTHLFSSV